MNGDTVSPLPDEPGKVEQYIKDRRVIGVSTFSKTFSTTCLNGAQYDPLVQPALLRHEILSSATAQRVIASARYNAAKIIAGRDDRLVVIVGPCSIHSPAQAMEYAKLLKSKIPTWPDLLIIMRSYL